MVVEALKPYHSINRSESPMCFIMFDEYTR